VVPLSSKSEDQNFIPLDKDIVKKKPRTNESKIKKTALTDFYTEHFTLTTNKNPRISRNLFEGQRRSKPAKIFASKH